MNSMKAKSLSCPDRTTFLVLATVLAIEWVGIWLFIHRVKPWIAQIAAHAPQN